MILVSSEKREQNKNITQSAWEDTASAGSNPRAQKSLAMPLTSQSP